MKLQKKALVNNIFILVGLRWRLAQPTCFPTSQSGTPQERVLK